MYQCDQFPVSFLDIVLLHGTCIVVDENVTSFHEDVIIRNFSILARFECHDYI